VYLKFQIKHFSKYDRKPTKIDLYAFLKSDMVEINNNKGVMRWKSNGEFVVFNFICCWSI